MPHPLSRYFHFLALISVVLLNDFAVKVVSAEHRRLSEDSDETRPFINTFFERIPVEKRFTDMEDADDDELLEFWKLAWSSAGWQPRILTRKDASKHPEYDAFLRNLTALKLDSFGEIVFMRHFVMGAAGGGFLADFDAFPIRDFRHDGLELPFKGEFAIYDLFAVNLASGSAEAWIDIATALVEDARTHVNPDRPSNFMTDTLGFLNLVRANRIKIHSQREVLSASKALNGDPLTAEQCNKRPIRGKRTIHVCPTCMISAEMEPNLRLPRHRVTVARQWLSTFTTICLNRTVSFL
jgi:hypothetical protein